MDSTFKNITYNNKNFISDDRYSFVVIMAKFNGKFIYVKHKNRKTWEIPGGHIEKGEGLLTAAKRELYEESGAIDFTIKQKGYYSLIDENNSISYGAVFLANIKILGSIPDSEISEIAFYKNIPNIRELTYPRLHSLIFEKLIGKEEKSISFNIKLLYDKKTDKFSKLQIPHPLSICYKVTKKCNFSCKHCIASSSISQDYGLETLLAKKVIKEIADSGIKRLDITGGEPFIRKDILELIKYSYDLGLETVITTNGSFLTKEALELLGKLGIFTQISIDGPKEINDKLRMKGSFDIAIKAINDLKKYNVPVRINCTIQQSNIDVIDYMITLSEKLKVKNLYFILVCAQGKAYSNKDNICLSDAQERIIRTKILQARMECGINVKMLDFKKYSRACTLIDYNGDFISQCYSETECTKSGNILKTKLNKLWQESGAFDHALHLMQYLRHPILYK